MYDRNLLAQNTGSQMEEQSNHADAEAMQEEKEEEEKQEKPQPEMTKFLSSSAK